MLGFLKTSGKFLLRSKRLAVLLVVRRALNHLNGVSLGAELKMHGRVVEPLVMTLLVRQERSPKIFSKVQSWKSCSCFLKIDSKHVARKQEES